MFGFLTIQPTFGSHALRTAAAASTWLRSRTLHDSGAHQRSVVLGLHEIAATPAEIDRDCIEALEVLDAAFEDEWRRQIAQYVANVDRSAAIASSIWNSLYETNQAFIGAYSAAVPKALAAPRSRWGVSFSSKVLTLLIRRFSLEIKLRAFRYQRMAPSRWAELQQLYRHVAEREIETLPVALRRNDNEQASTTVQQEYLFALLLDRINTGNLAPVEFELVSERMREWSRTLRLDRNPPALGGFVVDIAGPTGLVRWTGREHTPTLRFLDTSELVTRFRREVASLMELSPGVRTPSTMNVGPIAAFAKTWPAIAMVFVVDHRCAPREAVSAPARVAVGMGSVCDQLCMASAQPGEKRPAARADVPLTWTIVERSNVSLLLRTREATRAPIAVGTLLAVRAEQEQAWILGIARRVTRLNDDAVEVGVAIVTHQVVAATLHIEQATREDMRLLVDGVNMSGIGAVFRGLYIPPQSRTDPSEVGTLIVPTTNHDVGRRAVIAAGDEVRTLVLREPLEQHADWTWTAVEARRAA